MGKPRLLFLSQCLPFPANSGVRIRTFHTLQALSKDYDVQALCFFRASGHGTQQKVKSALVELNRFCHAEAFPIPQEHSRFRLILDHLKSICTGRVYTYFTYSSTEFSTALNRALTQSNPELVHLDSLDLSAALEKIPKAVPVSICHHNVESRLLELRATQESWHRRIYLKLQSRLMRREESRCSPRAAVNFAVSKLDQQALRVISPNAHFEVAPNGVDTKSRSPVMSTGKALLFIGGASWFPNLDALEYFGSEILPLLRARGIHVPIHWIGQCSERLKKEINKRFNLELVGFVDNLDQFLADSAVFIVPMRVGGGTRLKILDAWAWQLPVISTSVGCEGLEVENGQNIIVADTPAHFVDEIERLLNSPALRSSIGSAGRQTAVKSYDWQLIGNRMIHQIKNASNNSARLDGSELL